MTDLPSERGAGIEALLARRAASQTPPPPAPAMPAPQPTATPEPEPSPEPEPAPAQNRPARKRSKPSSAKPTAAPAGEDLIGQPVGKLRQIAIRVRPELRDRLDSEIASDPDASLGTVGMQAVREALSTLRERHTPKAPATSDGFAAPRRALRRSPRGTKVAASMLVTPEEAAALKQLSVDLSISVNRIVEEALTLRYAD